MKQIVRHFSKRSWGFVFINTVFVLIQVYLELKMPDYMAQITTLVQTQGSAMSDILLAGSKMLSCALGSLITAILITVISAKVAADYSADVRLKFYSSVQKFSLAELNRFSPASLITRATNDITQIQMVIVFGMLAIIKAPVMSVLAVTKIYSKNISWTMATAVAVVLVCIVLMICYFFALPKFKRIQGLTDNINRIMRENLTGLRVIRAYNAEDFQQDKFATANTEITDNNLRAHRIMAIMNPSMMFIMNSLTVVIYLIGTFIINASDVQDRLTVFSEMVVFSSYAMQVIMSFMVLNMIFIMAPRAIVAAKRINEVVDTKPSIIDGDKTEGVKDKAGTVEFRNVSFRYPDAAGDVLENISFKVDRGQTLAIIGSTGCGKSTLVNLIVRLYDATQGEVLVSGVNVKEYTLQALNNKIGYIPQKAVLFSGTVNTNVAFGTNGRDDYTQQDVKRAVRIAQAEDFVTKMPFSYDSDIAQGGTNVSGGQKQRLSIARAICKDPEILIFDDSFSALDYKTDKILRKTLKEETKGTTNIIVAQRIGTIKDADIIIVLDEGRIVGMGKHSDLLENCSVYNEIALSQLSKEELSK